jgi:TonB-dependent receptor
MLTLVRRWAGPTGLLLALRLILGLGSFSPPLAAAEAVRKPFALAAAAAEVALETFSDQADVQLVYLIDDVRGVATNPVNGEFAIRDALERLVTATGLRVEQDGTTGAFVIRRERSLRPPAEEPKPEPSRSIQTMKKKSPLALLGIWLGLTITAGPSANAADSSVSTGTITGRVQNIVTGQYLNNARVSIKGTAQTVFTDNFGGYTLVGVRSGPAVLEVFYTDLDLAQIPLNVGAGSTVTRDVGLTSVARYGKDADAVKLDPFVVTSDRETDAQAIATNEQRFAPNIKNVMATDSLGDVYGSSVGEFLKFMPGVIGEMDDSQVVGVSVRGIGGGMTAVTVDGVPSSNMWVGPTRNVDLRSMALNDVSRIEVTKVPTPSSPADSLGGSVNMVGKSAFERSAMEFRYSVNLVGIHENLTLKKTPHSYLDRKDYNVHPGFNFDFTWPITKTFGIVLTGMTTRFYNEKHFSRNTWANTGTGTNLSSASISNPYLQQYLLQGGPQFLTRNTLSLKADWKVTAHSVLSLGQTINRSTSWVGTYQMVWNASTNGTPTAATGVAATFAPTFTRGATGRGAMTTQGADQRLDQTTDNTNLTYRYDDGWWKLEAGLSRSASGFKRRYADAGFFLRALATNNRPIRINFLNIGPDKPGTIEVFDDNNQPFVWGELSNYIGTTALSQPAANRAQYNTGYLNLRRRFDFLPFPTALQVGGSKRVQTSDTTQRTESVTFSGPDGRSGATASMAPYAMQVYKDMDDHFGFHGIQWLSTRRAWEAYQSNPLLYTKTLAQQFADLNAAIDGYEFIEETVNAAYLQAEAGLFRNRLHVLGGVRFEQTVDDGQGGFTDADAVWQRDARGNYIRNAAGARIRKPEAGAVNSPEQIAVTRRWRGALAHRTYDGYYPSLHLTFDATEDVLVRAAYARTYGRPAFSDIIPRVVATPADLEPNDPTPITGRGTLSIRNTALIPWTADNFDLSAEYYTPQGGLFSAGVFRKDITNFFGSSSRIAKEADIAALGLDPDYLDWNIVTKFNAGDARITGAEINFKHSLRALGRWGSYFTVFANFTKLNLSGNPSASFTSFIPKSGNWGGTFSSKRFTMTARWNYRGLEKLSQAAAFGSDGYQYFKARTKIDLNASYQLTRKLSLVANVNNLLNEPNTNLIYGSQTPAYARQFQKGEFGIGLAVGLRGKF